MESEELRLLRENNIMLKQICEFLFTGKADNPSRDFLINLAANLMSEGIHNKGTCR